MVCQLEMEGIRSISSKAHHDWLQVIPSIPIMTNQMIPCGLQGAGKGAVEEHHARGYMLRKRGDFDSAILHYGKALEAQSNHFSALFNRGFCYDKVLAVLRKIEHHPLLHCQAPHRPTAGACHDTH